MNIPKGWKQLQVRDFVQRLEAGVSVNSSDEPDKISDKRVLKVSAVQGGKFFPRNSKPVLKSEVSRLRLNPKAGQIIVSRANTADLVGQCGYVPIDYPDVYLSDKLWQTVFRPNVSVSAKWLSVYLNSKPVRNLLLESATGTSGSMKNISKEAFLELPVLTPSYKEQVTIENIAEVWDRAIDVTSRLLEAQEVRKEALMKALLYPSAENPTAWIEYKIGDLLEEVSRDIVFDDEAQYSLASVRRRSGGLFYRQSLLGKQILTKTLKDVHAGDFLISRMQVVHGACALATEEFAGMKVSGSYVSLVSKDSDRLDIEFFDFLSRLPEMYVLALKSSYGVHIEKMTFNLRDYLGQRIHIPADVCHQRKVVKALRLVDAQIKLSRRKLTVLQEQKSALLQQLLTGELELKISN